MGRISDKKVVKIFKQSFGGDDLDVCMIEFALTM